MPGLWVVLIPFAVFIGIWVLSAILKAQQEPPRPPRANGPRPTSSSDQIDRFLQEIDRLRRRQEAERAEAARRQTTPTSAPPVPPPVRTRPAPRTVSAPRLRPPVQRPTFVPPPADVPTVPVVEAAPVARPAPAAPIVVPATTHSAVSPRAQMIVNLLHSSALPALVIVPEVLGPPRCKRPRERRA